MVAHREATLQRAEETLRRGSPERIVFREGGNEMRQPRGVHQRVLGAELAGLLGEVGFDDATLRWIAETVRLVPYGKVTLVTHQGSVVKIVSETVGVHGKPR